MMIIKLIEVQKKLKYRVKETEMTGNKIYENTRWLNFKINRSKTSFSHKNKLEKQKDIESDFTYHSFSHRDFFLIIMMKI